MDAAVSIRSAPYEAFIQRAATQYGVSDRTLRAMLRQESGFDPRAVSRVGAQGIAQFMPDTARQYGLSNPYDPAASIDAMGRYMRDLTQQFGGNEVAASAAYNRGPTGLRRELSRGVLNAETQNYTYRVHGPEALAQLTGSSALAPQQTRDSAATASQVRNNAPRDSTTETLPQFDTAALLLDENPFDGGSEPQSDYQDAPPESRPQRENPFDDRPPGQQPEVQQEAAPPPAAAPEPTEDLPTPPIPPARVQAVPAAPVSNRARSRMQRASAEYDDVLASIDARLFGES